MDMALQDTIERAALINAVQHNGVANPKAVIGRVLAENPKYRSKAKDIEPEVWTIVARINKLKAGEQRDLLKNIEPKFLEKKEKVTEERKLPDLEGAEEGKVVTRFEPSPSGPMHIGHAYVLSLNSELAKKYSGRCIVRVSDTNPENIYPKAYEMLKEDAQWLTKRFIKDEDYIIQSDRMNIYYKYAEKALKIGAAYVCTCDSEDWHKLMIKKKSCPCRKLSSKEQLKRWKHMLKDWEEGSAVVRIKTDLKHKNPAMRDWPAIRINETKHPRQGKKYRVWPLMNFAVAIDDYEMGITHSVRAKEHMDNEKRQQYLYKALGWKMAKHLYIGAINFIDLKVSKTKVKQAIKEGKFKGWDDVRLPFLVALRRRGYQPEAFIKYAIDVGISENDKTVPGEEFFKAINNFNKEIIDPLALRYSFVPEPVKIAVSNQPDISEISIPVSPYFKNKRKIKVGKDIWVPKEDFDKYNGKEIRLKDLFNIKLSKKSKFTSLKNKDIQKVQWVSSGAVRAEVLMPDGSVVKGLAEPNVKKLKVGDIIQFERFGFVRLDKKGRVLLFCFGHK